MWTGDLSRGKERVGPGAAVAPAAGAVLWIAAVVLLETRWAVSVLLSTFGFGLLLMVGAWLSARRDVYKCSRSTGRRQARS